MMENKELSELAGIIKSNLTVNSWMSLRLPILTATAKANQLGLLLRVENEKAFTARYGEEFSTIHRPEIKLADAFFPLEKSIKLVREYLYQISEGDFVNNKVYREIELFEYFLLREFFSETTRRVKGNE
jgi:hypothetical protein